MTQAWVDFTDVHSNFTTTLREYVRPGVELYVGALLLVGDDDGTLCDARVTGLHDSAVDLELDPATFRSDRHVVVTAAG